MDDEDILARVGTFFIVMASGFIVMFVVSDLAETVYFDLFFIGILLGGLGLYLRRRAPTPPPSGRFESYQKWRSGKLKDEMAERRESQKAERASKQDARKAEKEAKRAERGSSSSIFGRKKED
jgi:hypothetical protein